LINLVKATMLACLAIVLVFMGPFIIGVAAFIGMIWMFHIILTEPGESQ